LDRESIGYNSYLAYYRIDRATGELLVDAKVIYPEPPSADCGLPMILPGSWDTSLNLLWIEQVPGTGDYKLIRHAVIDLSGNFIIELYTAYDYSDDDLQNITYMAATRNEEGDLFISYSEGDISIPGYWIRLGWFDHNYLGVEDDSSGIAGPVLVLSSSCNPFSSSVTITCSGPSLPGQLMVYDIMGRLIRSLSDREGSSFLWDGRDGSGAEVPTGTYMIQGAIDGRATSIKVVRL
jgi:hypothetical protein